MQNQSDYFINQELVEEMVRLNRQAALVTQEMGGVLAEQPEPAVFNDVLDLACGPGEWAMQAARSFLHFQVVGVDKSRRMIAYAQAQAEAQERGVMFRVMDITEPLDFADGSFDLVNGRFLLCFLKREQWLPLLTECFRLLRPGGVLRITEQESGFANDPIYQQYMNLWGMAWSKAGHAFAHTPAYIGVTVEMKNLLRQAGFVAPRHRPIAIDLSTGQPTHQPLLENLVEALKLASPFLVRLNVTTQKKINTLHDEMKGLIGKEGFSAYWLLQTVWSTKPGNNGMVAAASKAER
ncbi:MAG: methyltransferase domain-containing protein [Ktedonobacteraceae bacterium]